MQLATVAAALSLTLMAFVAGLAAEPVPSRPGAAGPVAESPPASGDDAAKHTKRTACLKEARARKLVGTEKTAFVKRCVDAA